ncbi:MAG: 2OG-Fe(II) oxygenase [Bacteroidota bacterium]
MQFREPQPGILTLPLLDKAEADDIVKDIKVKTAWKPARVNGRKYKNEEAKEVRSATTASLSKASQEAELFNARVRSIIRPLIFKRWKHDILRHTDIQLVKYVPGDFFAVHRDNGQAYNDRYYTVVCYLNDNFEGGGTYFPSSDYTVEPVAGKAVIFPSDYLHKANEIISGEKYVAVIWMLDTEPVSWI